MAQWVKQSTQVNVHIGPFVDVGDGFTPETGVTLAAADEAEILKHGATSTTSIASNTMTAIASCDGWYYLTLTTTDTNTLGCLEVIVHDDSVCLPVYAKFMVVPSNVYDSMFGSDKLQVDAVEISSDSTAADNCEAMFDGTGYAGGTIKLGVDAVAISGDTTAADNCEAMFDGAGYAGGTIKLGVDVVAISGDSTAADNLESYCDGNSAIPADIKKWDSETVGKISPSIKTT